MNYTTSIILKPGKERAVLNRHPWIFSGAIKHKPSSVKSGDVVLICDHEKNGIALAHWCADTGLSCRIFSFDTDVVVDESFFYRRLLRAWHMRKIHNFAQSNTNGFRLVHGEGDDFSGLVVDIYNDTASIQLANPGYQSLIPMITCFLNKECCVNHVFINNTVSTSSAWVIGGSDEHIAVFSENSLSFFVDASTGQKTGHFLDQRDNRLLVKNYAANRTVLDAFCYSGGFSVYALLGGATHVTSLDIAKHALALAQKNVTHNSLGNNHITVAADCFEYLRTMEKDKFDLIVLDPPAFAKTAQTVMRASRGYKDINLLALKAIRSGGILFTFSCSHHIDAELFKQIIFAAAKDSRRNVKILKELGQGTDHPVSVYCPQSNYLKGLALYVD